MAVGEKVLQSLSEEVKIVLFEISLGNAETEWE